MTVLFNTTEQTPVNSCICVVLFARWLLVCWLVFFLGLSLYCGVCHTLTHTHDSHNTMFLPFRLLVHPFMLCSIDKDCNPQWTSVFTLDYVHGVEKYFFVRVMRLNKSRTDNKLVGGALFEIGDVLGSNRAKARRFKNGGW